MKFCPECGTPLVRENSRFCDNCGAQLSIAGTGQYTPSQFGFTTRQVREEKSPLVASLCSSFIPGLGQVYNGMTARGVALFVGTLFGCIVLLIPGLIVWVYAIYDAYSMAAKMNAGEIPFMPTRTAHMVIFAIVAIAIVAIIVILLILAALAEVGPMMQQFGSVRGFGFS